MDGQPSGDRLAVAVRGSGVWIYDLERETRKNLPMDGLNEVATIVWSPDGKRVAFNGLRGEQVVLAQQTIDGVGKPEVTVAQPGFELYAGSWLPDGKGFTYVAIQVLLLLRERTILEHCFPGLINCNLLPNTR